MKTTTAANNDSQLFCLDFDKTLVNGHFHSSLANAGTKAGQASPEQIGALLDNPDKGLKNPNEMKAFIESSIQAGHKVAITSFTSYPEVIEPTLKKMGLSDETISKIDRVAFLPKDQSQGKAQHMDIAMQNAGITDKSKVTLIDDDERNCRIARRAGMNAIEVPTEKNAPPSYIHEASRIAEVDKPKSVAVEAPQPRAPEQQQPPRQEALKPTPELSEASQPKAPASVAVPVKGISEVAKKSGQKTASVAKAAGLDALNTGGANLTAIKGEAGYRSEQPLTERQNKNVAQVDSTMQRKSVVMEQIRQNADKAPKQPQRQLAQQKPEQPKEQGPTTVSVDSIVKTQQSTGYKSASIAKEAGLQAANAGGLENLTTVKGIGEAGFRSPTPLEKPQRDQIAQVNATMGAKVDLMSQIRREVPKVKSTPAPEQQQHQSERAKLPKTAEPQQPPKPKTAELVHQRPAQSVETRRPSQSALPRSSPDALRPTVVNLDKQLNAITEKDGREAASAFKQEVFKIMQEKGLVPKGDNVRNMPEYMAGKSGIQVSRAIEDKELKEILSTAKQKQNMKDRVDRIRSSLNAGGAMDGSKREALPSVKSKQTGKQGGLSL